MTVAEVARALDLSEWTVYQLCRSGRLAHSRVGLRPGHGRIRIPEPAVAAYLKSCEVAPPAPPARPARRIPTSSGRPDGKPLRWVK